MLVLLIARPSFPSEDADTGSGLAIVAAWGLVVLLWAAQQVRNRRLAWYGGWELLVVGIFLALVAVSAFSAPAPRQALNMLCEWMALLGCFLMISQLFRTPQRLGLLVTALIATAFALSAYGIYQAVWGLEELRQLYRQNPQEVLRQLQIAPGSQTVEQFENRLRSHEAFSTFALANSLAGFLLPSVIVLLALMYSAIGTMRSRTIVCAALLSATTLLCLLLTQSRTGFAGLAIGCSVLAVRYLRNDRLRQLNRRYALIAAGVFMAVLLSGTAWALAYGKVDAKLLSESAKSVGYRWQYWTATTRLIGDHWALGTGVGNFRQHYLGYKLPESSEEISDPHNFGLEIAATAGIPAAALFLMGIGLGLTKVARSQGDLVPRMETNGLLYLAIAGGCGFFLASLLSSAGDASTYLVLWATWCLGAGLAWRLLGETSIPRHALVAALIGFLVHLCGAGGVSMPGVAQGFWVLLAIGLIHAQGSSECGIRAIPMAVLMSIAAAFTGFLLVIVEPVTQSRAAVVLGNYWLSNGQDSRAAAEYKKAKGCDPFSAEPRLGIARINLVRARSAPPERKKELYEAAERAVREAVAVEPLRLESWLLMGQIAESAGRRFPEFREIALESAKRCTELYPNNASFRFRYGQILRDADQKAASCAQFRKAARLDDLNPHLDKKLTPQQRLFLDRRLQDCDNRS